MALTEVQKCNAALGELGIAVEIAALTDTTREGKQCNRYFTLSRDELEEFFPWEFDKVRTALIRDGGYYEPTQAANPLDVRFSPDGKRMYVLSGTSVYQYTLTHPWDITTATYASDTFDFSTEEATPTGIAFNSAGTKMYMVGTTDQIVEQYSLSTPWDVSTATADAVTLDVSSEDTSPQGMVFANSGLKLYVVGDTNNSIFEYTLTTAYDLSTATYSTNTISVAVQDTSPRGVAIGNSGLAMFVIGAQSDAIHQYTLSTAYDVSTATADGNNLLITGDDNTPTGLFINSDGTHIFFTGTENDYVIHAGMALAWDITTASASAPEFGYDYSFVIPANTVRVLEVQVATQGDEPQWEMESRRILINEAKDVDIIRIKNRTDTNFESPLFQKTHIYNLGAYLAKALLNDSRMSAEMIVKRDSTIDRAMQMQDRQGNPDEKPPKSAWQRAGHVTRREETLPRVES
jgi:hypothetical protein